MFLRPFCEDIPHAGSHVIDTTGAIALQEDEKDIPGEDEVADGHLSAESLEATVVISACPTECTAGTHADVAMLYYERRDELQNSSFLHSIDPTHIDSSEHPNISTCWDTTDEPITGRTQK